MKMLPGQNKRLHALLSQLGLMDDKAALVYYFSAKRTDSAREMEQQHAQALIDYLAECAGTGGYTPPRGMAPAAQPAPAPAPPRRGRPPGSGKPAPPKRPVTDKVVPDAEAANRMRRKLFAIGRAIGWLSGETADELAMNRAKLDDFLTRRSYLKKPLKQYTPAELPKLVSQFDAIQKQYDKAASNREAGAAVASLLAELGLPTAPVTTSSPRKPHTR